MREGKGEKKPRSRVTRKSCLKHGDLKCCFYFKLWPKFGPLVDALILLAHRLAATIELRRLVAKPQHH